MEQKHAEVVGRRGSGWEAVEVKQKVRKTCGSWWKTRKGSEEVGKAVGEGGRSGRTWESNGTLQSEVVAEGKWSGRSISEVKQSGGS